MLTQVSTSLLQPAGPRPTHIPQSVCVWAVWREGVCTTCVSAKTRALDLLPILAVVARGHILPLHQAQPAPQNLTSHATNGLSHTHPAGYPAQPPHADAAAARARGLTDGRWYRSTVRLALVTAVRSGGAVLLRLMGVFRAVLALPWLVQGRDLIQDGLGVECGRERRMGPVSRKNFMIRMIMHQPMLVCVLLSM